MSCTRMEKNGIVAYVDGKTTKRLPAERACRERLIQLLEAAGGDVRHEVVEQFWRERAIETGDANEMHSAWATEVYTRLYNVWYELTKAPSPQVVADDEDDEDIFSAFD